MPFQELWTLAYIEVNTTTWDTEDTANDVGIAVFSRRAFFARFLAALPETHPAHEDSWWSTFLDNHSTSECIFSSGGNHHSVVTGLVVREEKHITVFHGFGLRAAWLTACVTLAKSGERVDVVAKRVKYGDI